MKKLIILLVLTIGCWKMNAQTGEFRVINYQALSDSIYLYSAFEKRLEFYQLNFNMQIEKRYNHIGEKADFVRSKMRCFKDVEYIKGLIKEVAQLQVELKQLDSLCSAFITEYKNSLPILVRKIATNNIEYWKEKYQMQAIITEEIIFELHPAIQKVIVTVPEEGLNIENNQSILQPHFRYYDAKFHQILNQFQKD